MKRMNAEKQRKKHALPVRDSLKRKKDREK